MTEDVVVLLLIKTLHKDNTPEVDGVTTTFRFGGVKQNKDFFTNTVRVGSDLNSTVETGREVMITVVFRKDERIRVNGVGVKQARKPHFVSHVSVKVVTTDGVTKVRKKVVVNYTENEMDPKKIRIQTVKVV